MATAGNFKDPFTGRACRRKFGKTLISNNNHNNKSASSSKKRQFEKEEVEYTIESPGARNMIAMGRGKFHTAVGKYKYAGKIGKQDTTPKYSVQASCVNLLFEKLERNLQIVGPHNSTWHVNLDAAKIYSEGIEEALRSPLTKVIKMLDHPVHAIDCCTAHILHHSDFRVVNILEKQELYHVVNHPSPKKGPVIPLGVTASQIHVDVLILAYRWRMKQLKIYACIELVHALGKKGSPSFAEFKKLVLDTKIFTAKFCEVPACDDEHINDALSALGTYAALHRDKWLREHRIAYTELLPKAPYLAKYCDLAQADHPAFLRDHNFGARKARLEARDGNHEDEIIIEDDTSYLIDA